jgi:transposase-like protein
MEASVRTKKNRVQRSESDWKSILGEYDRSGQTRAAFCRKTGISSSTFLLWERKLRRQSRAAEFVAVTPATQPASCWAVEFQFPDGTTARVRG